MDFERTIDDIIETLLNAKNYGKKCALLIGTGCSAQAGIPTAEKFVDIIERDRPRDFARAPKKSYSSCMGQLAPGERRDLIANFTDETKINWAHIIMAQLMKVGFVDRILTTNFDPLLIKACAMLNEFPAVYDLTASTNFRPSYIPEKSVFYLHGQRTGFELINTAEEFAEHSKRIQPVIQDTARGRVWIVVGYSGRNDPVFDIFASFPRFDYKLYWVGYRDNPPEKHIKERLLQEGKHAYFVKGYDADSFFVSLAKKLGCFPPDFLKKPFSFLKKLFDNLAPCECMNGADDIRIEDAVEKIERAIENFEN
ncbi:MAG: SIR2 family protein [Kosmotoga sp.]|uniref:SIR2 family protein n=1 Tax=Kosmotoga sp. TaxID=1955248 RepID=UPI0025C2FA17|nr:SIR2 family protein [Kosmotoga sp.]MCD6160157.1 SIR2 family protein [Kosmotoga sp.]